MGSKARPKDAKLFILSLYYQIIDLLNQKIDILLPLQIRQTVSDEFKSFVFKQNSIRQLSTDELIESRINQEDTDYLYRLICNASFTHFVELIKIDDHTKRRFYELLILKTTPNVKELQRQINTLTFERLGLSGNYQSSFEQIQLRIKPEQSQDLWSFPNTNHLHRRYQVPTS